MASVKATRQQLSRSVNHVIQLCPYRDLAMPLHFNRPIGKQWESQIHPRQPAVARYTPLGLVQPQWWVRVQTDAEADILLAEAASAICVQRFDGSRNSAIHTTYRISLRSSSLREPRYPLLRVVLVCIAKCMATSFLRLRFSQ
jgi:hypothetical protein